MISPYKLFSRLSLAGAQRLTHSSVYLSRLIDFDSSEILKRANLDAQAIVEDIQEALDPSPSTFRDLVRYQFNAHGKLLRPLLVTLVSACANVHANSDFSSFIKCDPLRDKYCDRTLASIVSPSQHRIAMIAEMIHTASLIHDDVLDSAPIRRGKEATYKAFGFKEAILGGDFILTYSSRLLSEIGNTHVIAVLSRVIEDLINGELMQLTHNTDDTERFQLYLNKTYRKTASLMANSCKATAMLTNPALPVDLIESIYEFGRHLGMAFQLIDDVLDFTADEESLGKPAGGADLDVGVITGPVLFAAQRFPELDAILLRQFSLDGDKERAMELIEQSDGIGQTRMLAEFHFQAAQRCLERLQDSAPRSALLHVAATFIQRDR